jgi:tetratricopeptide (TPR) repeat protein
MKLTAKDYVHRAGLRHRKGDHSGALADLNRAIDLDPSTATAYFARGDLKRVGGDPDGAIVDLTTAIRLNPSLPLAHVARGNAHRNKGEAHAAIADFNKAIRLDAKSSLAYVGRGMARSQARKAGAISDFSMAIRLDSRSPEAFFGRGWARFSAGDADGAISDLTKAIALDPHHSVAFMLRGEAHRDKGQTERAIEDLTKAIKLGVPDWGHAYGQRGVERMRKGDLKGALADLTQAIEAHAPSSAHPEADTKLAQLRLARGTALLGLGEPRKALADLTAATQMDPSLKRLASPLLRSAQQEAAKIKQRKAPPAHSKPRTRRQTGTNDYGSALREWEDTIRAQASADDYACFRRLLAQIGINKFTPKQLLEGTIELARAALVYSAGLDGHPFEPFLKLQQYNPLLKPNARYTLVFDIHGRGIGRLLEADKFKNIDLADLYGHPYETYKRVGFSGLWILRSDYTPFTRPEPSLIKQHIHEDLYFDYTPDEIQLSFRKQKKNRILVRVRDRSK